MHEIKLNNLSTSSSTTRLSLPETSAWTEIERYFEITEHLTRVVLTLCKYL